MSISTLFTHNRSQAVRLPVDARDGPEGKRIEARVAAMNARVSDNFLPERATQLQAERNAL